MDVHEAIYNRHSVRKYADTPVERGTIEELLMAAVQAPSGMNSQPWAFGVVQGADAVRALNEQAKAVLMQAWGGNPEFAERYGSMFNDPNYQLFYGAPALVVIFGKQMIMPPDVNCAMAALNLMLTAWDKGLGTCWIGFAIPFFNQPEVKQAFGIPEEYAAIAPLIIGHPAGDIPPVEKNPPTMLFWKS